jgi:hypothetical protein
MTTEDTPPEDKQPAAPKKRRGRPPGAPDRRKRKGRKSTVKNSTTSPRKIVKTKKFVADVETALEYRIMGYTFAQISKEMGFKPGSGYAHRLVDWALSQVPSESVERLRAVQTHRLEAVLTGFIDKAIGGDAEAAETCLRVMDQFNKLHGLLAA